MKKAVKVLAMFLAMTVLFSCVQTAFAAEETLISADLLKNEEFSFGSEFDNMLLKSSVSAAEETYEEDGWTYYIEEDYDYAIITECAVPDRFNKIRVPEELGGKPVFYWESDAFDKVSDREYTLSIPDSMIEALMLCFEISAEYAIYILLGESLIYVNPVGFSVYVSEEDEESKYLTTVDGVLYTKDKSVLIKYPTGNKEEMYSVPKNVNFYLYIEEVHSYTFTTPFFYRQTGKDVVNDLDVHISASNMERMYDVFARYVYDPDNIFDFNKKEMFAVYCLFSNFFDSYGVFCGAKVCTDWDEDMVEYFYEVAFDAYSEIKLPFFYSCSGYHDPWFDLDVTLPNSTSYIYKEQLINLQIKGVPRRVSLLVEADNLERLFWTEIWDIVDDVMSIVRGYDSSKTYSFSWIGNKRGTATIKVSFYDDLSDDWVYDENGDILTIEHQVEIEYTWWQWLIKILLFGWIWY